MELDPEHDVQTSADDERNPLHDVQTSGDDET